MKALCEAVLNCLDAGTPPVLVTMTDHRGSVPRTAGARMLVLPGGKTLGTVGGGRYEAEAVALGLELLEKAGRLPEAEPASASPLPNGAVLEFSLRGVTDMDMICGGALSLLLEYIPDTADTRSLFTAGRDAELTGRPFVLAASFRREETGVSTDGKVAAPAGEGTGKRWAAWVSRYALFFDPPASDARRPNADCNGGRHYDTGSSEDSSTADGTVGLRSVPGSASLPPEVLRRAAAMTDPTPHHVTLENTEYVLEYFPPPFHIILFGGGHVSREVARLAAEVDFQVTVVDDRPEYANPERFPGAIVRILPSLGQEDAAALLSPLGIGERHGLVIVTRGHSHDRDVLAAALGTQAGYIGMIGSRSKREGVYAALVKAGFGKEALAAVHSPIGLAIGAETPQEIAVSIVGELIQWRRNTRDAATALDRSTE